jgi:hypothetical protein
LPFTLAIKLGLGIGREGMGLVAALFAVEIALAVATFRRRLVRANQGARIFRHSLATELLRSVQPCRRSASLPRHERARRPGERPAYDVDAGLLVVVLRTHFLQYFAGAQECDAAARQDAFLDRGAVVKSGRRRVRENLGGLRPPYSIFA